jgi:hypothetical protein
MQFFTHIVNHISLVFHSYIIIIVNNIIIILVLVIVNNNNNNNILRWVSELSSLKFLIQCNTADTALGFGLLLIADRLVFH